MVVGTFTFHAVFYNFLPQYCLRWTRHPNMLCAALESSSDLSAEEPFLDLVFHLDDGSVVHLHSLVLAASSQYFSSLGKVRQSERNYFVNILETQIDRNRRGKVGCGAEISLSLHRIVRLHHHGRISSFFSSFFLRNFLVISS